MVRAEDADAVGGADERGRDGVLVGLEQRGRRRRVADEPVLVVDEERLRAALRRRRAEQGQLRAEDEGVVEVDDVEAFEPREARDERGVADREHGVDPVDIDPRDPGLSPSAGAVKTST